MRCLESPGRSPVHSTHGMAATSHPLSSNVALDILKQGGNALDAAIAACAVQCVVEPHSTGIGGDCFCLYAPEGSADLVAYNGSGKTPAAATIGWYQQQGITSIERQSPHSVTVPGAVNAWHQLNQDHGRLSLAELLAPAIGYARNGYPVSSRVSVDFARQIELLRNDRNAASVFLVDGETPAVGSLHRQPALATTLEAIAQNGRDAFYSGEIASDMVDYLNELGGLHTLEDFSSVSGEYVTPLSTSFRDYQVHQVPPNGQGIIALQLLNIASGFAVEEGKALSADRIHLEIEAGRLAYQDRSLYVADQRHASVPVEWMLSAEHAEEMRSSINPSAALDELPQYRSPKQQSTVYISVVDKDRNTCSFINSIFHSFGSVQMAPRSGVMFHNRGESFVVEPGHPNCIDSSKRPMHTIIPGMVTRDDRAVMPYGVMGGDYQSYGHMQFLTRFLDFGMDIQEAQDMPRIFPAPGSRDVEVESTLPQSVVEALRAKGHRIVPAAIPLGGSQAIWIDWSNGVLSGGSDPRKDGCAIGY
ncbi:gamma-glutamyltransferase [Chromatiales bacterium (ex Bugula neritina AB1)]|nr:gamma-glutamyltransferase [Chromatiales bacterium (ex Bugula neritina AB1)]